MQPPDRNDGIHRHGIDIAEAVQRAPLETPPRSAWPQLQAELARGGRGGRVRSARRRHWWAAAATLLLAASLPALLRNPPPATQDATAVTTTSGATTGISIDAASSDVAEELATLRRESAALEAWLAASHDDTVISATGDGLRLALNARVQYVDALIGDPQTGRDTQLSLWRERVLLLRRLASIESSQQLLAVNGDAEGSQLVMAF